MLKGKVAVITGASRGIGAEVARVFAKNNAKVVVNYNKSEKQAVNLVEELKKMGNENKGCAIAVKADVSRKEEAELFIDSAIKSFGKIDILVNNACSAVERVAFAKSSWENFQEKMDIVLKGAYNCTKAALKSMEKGAIVNVVSTYTLGTPPPKISPYVTAKYGLLGFTRALAAELGPKIRVNAVSPGMTQTELIAHLPEKLKEIVAEQTPMKRLAMPRDIAEAVLFLASDRAEHITGINLPVNGGINM